MFTPFGNAFAGDVLRWSGDDLAWLERGPVWRAPVIRAGDVVRVSDSIDVWDSWPLADSYGMPVRWRGGELWFALAAPVLDDPEARHGHARIHHFHRIDGRFVHLGPTFPDGFTPGSREWSGSATLREGLVTLRFTAAGERGEDRPSFRQRLFSATTRLIDPDASEQTGGAVFAAWSEPAELAVPRDVIYTSRHDGTGRVGEIKAFRDPAAWWAEGGAEYLLFTASCAEAPSSHDGLIGLARREPDGTWCNLPPMVDARGTNNELERPHIIQSGGLLYLFWSTQAAVFAPGIAAPTGLYGAVAERIEGPWRLLNGHGLVFANPVAEPYQTYSWWVLPDLTVAAFVDYWGIDNPGAVAKPAGRSHFGGTFAPFLRLKLNGARSILKGTPAS
ncbi:glycoside hydrolase family 68 protein [Novosphingobium colocasiae]|uniref:Glycoside hydrolase 68 family protein n=1 Tax=Novosphingobium colocasiae TaxID=1256513 RepID=A0A918PBL3_9SPHN|nr:glycoside hydrolase family 68 protein [Novosphingobium colocasiae]GGY94790.1 glycoside hydrolase 68 family protein [Novosphingobium colocasiae]